MFVLSYFITKFSFSLKHEKTTKKLQNKLLATLSGDLRNILILSPNVQISDELATYLTVDRDKPIRKSEKATKGYVQRCHFLSRSFLDNYRTIAQYI